MPFSRQYSSTCRLGDGQCLIQREREKQTHSTSLQLLCFLNGMHNTRTSYLPVWTIHKFCPHAFQKPSTALITKYTTPSRAPTYIHKILAALRTRDVNSALGQFVYFNWTLRSRCLLNNLLLRRTNSFSSFVPRVWCPSRRSKDRDSIRRMNWLRRLIWQTRER